MLKRQKYQYIEAVLWVLLSTAAFTLVFAAAKFADGIIATFQIMFFRYIGSVLTLIILAANLGSFSQYRSKAPQKHFLRAVFGCSAAAAITWASVHMPVADASAIGILYGVMTVILGIVFLKESVDIQQWLAVLISVVGALLVMYSQGAFQSNVSVFPALIALLSAVLMASEGLLIRVLSQTETAMSMMFYINVFGIVLMAIPAFVEWQTVSIGVFAACLALGPLSILAQYCTIRGYRIAPLSVVGPIDYSWVIFAMILGFAVFDEAPTFGLIAGATLIIIGGVVLSSIRTQQPGE